MRRKLQEAYQEPAAEQKQKGTSTYVRPFSIKKARPHPIPLPAGERDR